ncbi:MAG: PEP-utilizing enzyme [Clostridium sp.]|nr:PEP-utilizing enzyme [Clostridium sp.]
MMIEFGTKAETLKRIKGRLSEAEILPLVYFTVGQWHEEKETLWANVLKELPCDELIIRSSAINEDTAENSQAGKFESIGHVSGKENFFDAVNTVISSFDDASPDNQVLVQPMLKDVKICGVAFTVDPNTLGNYYVINYDETGSTSSITAGTVGDNKLLYVFKDSDKYNLDNDMSRVWRTLAELERLFDKRNLDVEFAIKETGELFIFQVRILCLQAEAADCAGQRKELEQIEAKIKSAQSAKPFLCGKKTIYGVMPDWNPAEMIGIRPKPLAMSLYKEIITDSIWAYQRDNYGYRNLRSFPLMMDFCGLPYIDIRVSFNSFIPASLDEAISEKLVNYYIDRLAEEPSKHDKVEFDIVFSCYTLSLPQRIMVLKEYGFTEDEIQQIVESLRSMTNNIIDHKTGLWRKDYAKIEVLERRYDEILNSDMTDIEKIYWLLEDCKRYGTLPFAGLARAAFIAVQMLQSLITNEIISEVEYQQFMNDINTVSSNMSKDFKVLSKADFLLKYGHLRPGTYDISSKRYDEAPDLYFDWNKREKDDFDRERESEHFKLSLDQLHRLENALEENGLNNNILELMDFIKCVIEGREYGKFIFTKSLSKAIQMIGEMGASYGISQDDCSYIDIKDIQRLYSTTNSAEDILKNAVAAGKKNYEKTMTITLPPVILEPSDVWYFYYPDTEPNYITLNTVRGDVIVLENQDVLQNIEGKLLLIPSADPGYDWIFSHKIRGFITMYGGANSHMAIRAGELGIPAVIGVGTKQFEKYKAGVTLEIDCLAKAVRIIR